MKYAVSKFRENGFTFSKKRLQDNLIKYLGLRGRSIFELADKGYQSSPSVFDEVSLREYIVHNFPYISRYLVGAYDDGFKLKHIELALLKSKDEELTYLLKTYYNIVLSERYIKLANRVDSNVGFKKSSDTIVTRSRLCLNGKVDNYGKIPLDDEYCYDFLEIPAGKAVKKVCFTSILRKHLLDRLGLEDTDNTAKFIEGIDLDSELNLFDFIVSGCCECDGEFAEALMKDYNNFVRAYKENASNSLSLPSYASQIFNESIEDISAYTSEIIKQENGTYFFLTNNDVYYLVDSSEPDYKYFSKDGVLNVGVYCVDTYDKFELPKTLNLLGLCGEFYPSVMLGDTNITNTGLSFKLNIYNGKKKPILYDYVSALDVNYSSEGGSILPVIDDISDVNFRTDNIDWWDKVKALSGSLLIAELTNALIMCEYGSFEYHARELKDFNISEDVFMHSAYEAEKLFHALGF